jgi:dUTP pyrophosphatase|tara:strand:+ start:1193 stop:1633 length:441 start_codon:yes stop_codon:yes gene_type:complete
MSAMNNTHLLQLKLNNDDSMTPIRGSEQSAGYDLYSYEEKNILPGETKLFDTGISFRVPIGTYGRIAPRSGLSKKGLLVNAGVIDRDYTGPVKIMLHNLSNDNYLVKKNDRIAQLILERIETPEIVVVDSLDDTQRGSDGFGSTGN